MTRIISILLLCGLLSQTALKIAIYFDYSVNREYITLRYCENKKKPSLKCQGKCHMMKKMNEGEKKELPSSRTEQTKQEVQISEQIPTGLVSLILSSVNFLPYSNPENFYSKLSSIFHPPCF